MSANNKARVYGIAKDLNLNSKEVLANMAKYGVVIKNHMSALKDSDVDLIFEIYTQMYDLGDKPLELEEEKKDLKKSKEVAKTIDISEKDEVHQETIEDIRDKVIEKKVRYVDTRIASVELDKIDDEKLEELVPDSVKELGK